MNRIFIHGTLFWSVLFFGCQSNNELVWSDEFDGDAIDSNKWEVVIGNGCPGLCGFGNQELQYYTDDPKNMQVADGILTITALKDSVGVSGFTSAKLVTKDKAAWQYGRMEVRARIPAGRGNWPAIWMLPEDNVYGGWPRSGEIDIMEHVGYDHGNLWGTIHTQSFNHMKQTEKNNSIAVPDISDAFHVYAIEWREDRIDWFLDDQKYHTFENSGMGSDDWPFDHPFYMILNLAIGGTWGGKQGIANDIFPNRLEIDYVRVYDLK
jgi:beta-glucanase (GH16 family)